MSSYQNRNRRIRALYSTEARKPLPGRRVTVNGYDPVTDVACGVMKVPYGTVYVREEGSEQRSHEMILNGGDGCLSKRDKRNAFIDPHTARLDQQERSEARQGRRMALESAYAGVGA